jgi:hypothetical protein
MKVTALILFLILLIVLVVSVMLGKLGKARWAEGFVTYQESLPAGNTFILPTYSTANSVTKLVDNLFFDPINANLVEIDSPQFQTGGVIDLAGTSIISTTVTVRENGGGSNQYSGNVTLNASGDVTGSQSVNESLTGSVQLNKTAFVYESLSKNTDTYCVFYIGWNDKTYMHIIDETAKAHVATFVAKGSSLNSKYYPVDSHNVPNSAVGLTGSSSDNDPNNNSFVTDILYDPTKILYQVGQNVKYDITNGNLIVNTSTGINVYGHTSPVTNTNYTQPGQLTKTATSVQSVPFTPTLINDTLGNNVVLFIPDGTNTLVVLFSKSGSSRGYKLNNVVRFTATDVDNDASSGGSGVISMFNDFTNRFLNQGQLPYMQNGGNMAFWSMHQMHQRSMYDDYILKTQVVPPVCPSCPNCMGGDGGACNYCGGHGGCGTRSMGGNTVVSGNNPSMQRYDPNTVGAGAPITGNYSEVIGSGVFASNADANTLAGGLTLMSYDMTAGAEDIAKTAASVAIPTVTTTGDVLKTGISDTAGVLTTGIKEVGSGLGAVGSGIYGATTNVVGGAVGLAEGAGSGLMHLGQRPTYNETGREQGHPYGQVGQASQPYGPAGTAGPGSGSSGTSYMPPTGYATAPYGGTQSMDQYSYYGTLPAKNSANYMPVTADFSSFRH